MSTKPHLKTQRLAQGFSLTERQIEGLAAAYRAGSGGGDGWIRRGFCRIWGVAPTAIMALVRKGYLEMPHGNGRARLTEEGRGLVEANPERFGFTKRTIGARGAHGEVGQRPADAGARAQASQHKGGGQ